MPDPLATVLRLRRVTVDEAKLHLANQLRLEEDAEGEATAAEAALGIEADIASDLAAGDHAVEAFAAWLPTGRARAEAARLAWERARSEVAKARAALTVSRAAAQAAETMLGQRRAARAAEAARRAQAEADEAASRVREPAGPISRKG